MNIKKTALTLILIIVLMTSIGCGERNVNDEDNTGDIKSKIPVEIAKVRMDTLYNNRIFSGRILAGNEAIVIPQIQGKVKDIEVELGDKVSKGDILFTVEGVSTQIGQSISNYGNIPKIIKQEVKSPIDGVVSIINIREEQAFSTTQPPMMIISLDKMYVEINVTGDIINALEKGQQANVIVDAVSKREINGEIDTISPQPDMRTQLYPVKILIDNEDNQVKPGMFAEVIIKTDIKENVVVIPSDAVIYRDEKTYAYVVEDEQAIEREIKTGMDTGELIEIVNGLENQEDVIIKGQNYVENATLVKVVRGEE